MTLNQWCEQGQRLLIETQYLEAIDALLMAESLAVASNDYDSLSRLYMPLQEARRQVRQRCGEGVVRLDILPESEIDPDPMKLIDRYPTGQLLIAGLGSIGPAKRFRELAHSRKKYVETFLAATFPIVGGATAVAVVPTADIALPTIQPRGIDALLKLLPAHSRVFSIGELPVGERQGTSATFDDVSNLWESLHQPFLAVADHTTDPAHRVAAYRRTIEVDYGCELAHQKLSATFREMGRRGIY